MSASSATTLISPSNARTPSSTGIQRRPSTHSAHPHGHHTTKRRASSHATHGHHGQTARKAADNDQARRSLAAGLQMHALDTTDAVRKQKKEQKRPLAKNTRSDTHLPRLSRTTSMTSTTSHSSNNSRGTSGHGRPRRNSHVKSEESVHVLNDKGEVAEEVENEEDGGWEDGELEISPEKSKKGKERKASTAAVTAAMRRTVSDTSVEPIGTGTGTGKTKDDRRKSMHHQHPSISGILGDGNLVQTPGSIPHHPAFTQRTTGFAGGVQPLDPQLAAQLPAPDPHPIATPHPIKRNQSAKSLVGPIAMEPTQSNGSYRSHASVLSTEPPKHNIDGDLEPSKEDPTRQRSTEGSGLYKEQNKKDASSSPSYPFPQMVVSEDHPTSQTEKREQTLTGSNLKDSPEEDRSHHLEQQQKQPRSSTNPLPSGQTSAQSRSRQTSNPGGPHTLRHRYSNSSLRSIQSLRAPPHPLNSPAGYRAASRPGSMFGSPTKGKNDRDRERVPSMHQPPLPQPQVSYEVAQGQGWDAGIPEEDVPRRATKGAGPGTAMGAGPSKRKDSVSSVRSIFAGTMMTSTSTANGTTTASPSFSRTASGLNRGGSSVAAGADGRSTSSQPSIHRRQTALEAASAASKMHVTSDQTLYHHSLGHSSSTAETCFLVSRFLPIKKNKDERPKWEMDMRDPSVHEELEAGNLKVGLTNGDYRQAHESLIRTIRELGSANSGVDDGHPGSVAMGGGAVGNGAEGKRGVSTTYSGYSLDQSLYGAAVNYNQGESLGTVRPKGKENARTGGNGAGTGAGAAGGGLTVARGAFKGKTPFEMSVERCMAQRPGGKVLGL